jgi:hypothetical protein
MANDTSIVAGSPVVRLLVEARDCRHVSLASGGVLALLLPADCYAYIDPNMGGWLFQMLFPVLVAIGGAWIVLRQRISDIWNRLFRHTKVNKDSN